ncbi:hypothetical protein UlMin_033090 [Ulmus minor]
MFSSCENATFRRSLVPCLSLSIAAFGTSSTAIILSYMLLDQEVHTAEFERTFIMIKPDGVQRGLIVVPSKDFAQKHYHDLKERPFFNGLCDFLSSGPVIAMVRRTKTILALMINIIHGSDGPETAKDEINLWFKPEELVSYTSNAETWIYGQN